ncbi:hypothetical protein Hamer_G027548 [Homarus americanus]|uniref:Uncharacterized protein n=1 Tax=Homarus americanus TaxID=6706 RepID=A0A8J5K6X7_HOMAM|nr:hypothetical protein Hamer_G027548 [Homarus americanus]
MSGQQQQQQDGRRSTSLVYLSGMDRDLCLIPNVNYAVFVLSRWLLTAKLWLWRMLTHVSTGSIRSYVVLCRGCLVDWRRQE